MFSLELRDPTPLLNWNKTRERLLNAAGYFNAVDLQQIPAFPISFLKVLNTSHPQWFLFFFYSTELNIYMEKTKAVAF